VKVLYGKTKKPEKMNNDEWEEHKMKAMTMGTREYASVEWTMAEKNGIAT